MKVFLLEDDNAISMGLKYSLEKEGYEVTLTESVEDARNAWMPRCYDICILDINLPDGNGYDVCEFIKKKDVPVIFLTASDAEVNVVMGLEMGADDYLPKPFNPRELLARIGAVLRRRPDAGLGDGANETQVFYFGDFELDLASRSLKKKGEKITLTTGEFTVLKVLATNARQSLSREKLMSLAKGREYEVFDRSLDVQISRLRKLIEDDPTHPQYIQTVWGVGYVFIPDSVSKE